MECFGTLLAFAAKFYKSGKHDKHRYHGFMLTLLVTAFWCCYFINMGLWWLAFYNVVGAGMVVRGIINNRKVVT